jgi:hypothetical protein
MNSQILKNTATIPGSLLIKPARHVNLLLTLMVILVMASCTKKEVVEKTFTINAEKHSCNHSLYESVGNRLSFSFYVDESWYYPAEYDLGWSKLIGISNALDHHQSSVRIGWRCINGQIVTSLYCYVNGERKIKTLDTIASGWNYGSVEIATNAFYATVNDVTDSINKTEVGDTHLLYPYFGGTMTAPHDMKFTFKFN